MSIKDLVEYEDEDGDYIAIWVDTEDNTVVVQYNFVHFTLAPDNFTGLAEAIREAHETFQEEIDSW